MATKHEVIVSFSETGARGVQANVDGMTKSFGQLKASIGITSPAFDNLFRGIKSASKATHAYNTLLGETKGVVDRNKAAADRLIQTFKTKGSLTQRDIALARNIISSNKDIANSETLRRASVTKGYENQGRANRVLTTAISTYDRLEKAVNQATAVKNREQTQTEKLQQQYNELVAASKRYQADLDALILKNQRLNKSVDEGDPEYKRLVANLGRVEIELRDTAEASEKFSQELSLNATKAANSVSKSMVGLQKNIKGAQKHLMGQTRSANAANQMLLTFGDTVQDSAQFQYGFATGMRAVGNNITFAAEQFAYLQAEIIRTEGATGATKKAFKGLVGSLAGPGGAIILLNTVVTILTVFTQRSKEAKNEVESLGDVFMGVSKDISRSVFGDAEALSLTGTMADIAHQFRVNSEQIANSNVSVRKSAVDVAQELEYNAHAAITTAQANNIARREVEKAEEANKKLIETTSSLLNIKEDEAEQILKTMAAEQDAVAQKEALRRAQILLIPGGEEFLNIQDELKEIQQDLTLAEAERTLGMSELTITTEEADERLKDLANRLIATGIQGPAFVSLLNEIAGAMSNVADETKDATDGLSIFSQLQGLVESGLISGKTAYENYAKGVESGMLAERGYLISLVESGHATEEQIERLSDLDGALEIIGGFIPATATRLKDDTDKLLGSINFGLKLTTGLFSSLNQLSQTRSQVSEEAARKEFEIQKKLAISSAIVNAAAAGVEVLKETDGGSFARIAGMAAVLAAAGVQIAAIRKQQFGASGDLPGADGGASAPEFGFQMSEVEGPQTFRTPGYTPTESDTMVQPKTEVQVLANRKELYAVVKRGEEEYRNIKAT